MLDEPLVEDSGKTRGETGGEHGSEAQQGVLLPQEGVLLGAALHRLALNLEEELTARWEVC